MNAAVLGEKFKILLNYEKHMNYRFEPRCIKEDKNWKRHFNFIDFKEDFVEDITMFGFSPFILKTSKEQRKDPNIMKYKPKNFNFGLVNYIKRKQKTIAASKRHISTSPKGVIVPKSKKSIFLSEALKQISKKNPQIDEDNILTDENYPKQEKPKEQTRTLATIASEPGLSALRPSQRNFILANGYDSKRSCDFELSRKMMLFNSKNRVSSNFDSKKEKNRYPKKAIIFKIPKFRKTFSQLKPILSQRNLTIKQTNSSYKDTIRTRNQDLGPNSIFSKAKIIGHINLSS